MCTSCQGQDSVDQSERSGGFLTPAGEVHPKACKWIDLLVENRGSLLRRRVQTCTFRESCLTSAQRLTRMATQTQKHGAVRFHMGNLGSKTLRWNQEITTGISVFATLLSPVFSITLFSGSLLAIATGASGPAIPILLALLFAVTLLVHYREWLVSNLNVDRFPIPIAIDRGG